MYDLWTHQYHSSEFAPMFKHYSRIINGPLIYYYIVITIIGSQLIEQKMGHGTIVEFDQIVTTTVGGCKILCNKKKYSIENVRTRVVDLYQQAPSPSQGVRTWGNLRKKGMETHCTGKEGNGFFCFIFFIPLQMVNEFWFCAPKAAAVIKSRKHVIHARTQRTAYLEHGGGGG